MMYKCTTVKAVTSPISYHFVRSPSFYGQKLLEQWLTIIDKGSASNAPLPFTYFWGKLVKIIV